MYLVCVAQALVCVLCSRRGGVYPAHLASVECGGSTPLCRSLCVRRPACRSPAVAGRGCALVYANENIKLSFRGATRRGICFRFWLNTSFQCCVRARLQFILPALTQEGTHEGPCHHRRKVTAASAAEVRRSPGHARPLYIEYSAGGHATVCFFGCPMFVL